LVTPSSSITTIPPLSTADLDVLKSVRVVTGYVVIDGGKHSASNRPTSLSFLDNLEMIEGRHLYFEKYALYVIGNPDLKWLGLRSLKRVKSGLLSFTQNTNLCYSHTIPFRSVLSVRDSAWKNNARAEDCDAAGRRCDSACDAQQGCWGPGPAMCVRCKDFSRDGVCASECPADRYYTSQEDKKVCVKCHQECDGCSGTRSVDCRKCRNYEYWTRRIDETNSVLVLPEAVRMCVPSCPNNTYAVAGEKRCEPCHSACYEYGCTGPSSLYGEGGCRKCQYAVEVDEPGENAGRMKCLISETEELACGTGNNLSSNYFVTLGEPSVAKYVSDTISNK